ncbi:ABC transporter substrate-binding protein [Aminobacter aminovorans]|uniref:Peptide/nickel transport system substrate-binding protein n=1 Tax=Aminobacter aminovorans TaxID=83263 RepID=A0AAC8YW14_AMIAI|nr:ABC transporter substrate-binding protein [Aminobacter aminovorans]AMS45455.1 Tat pathway signal sequence domain protein [Aminobacter aminovorans]MBB3708662.1 peptide/nickel transport system substrate-binding protein [Aminobacter aminovorans]
MNRRELLGIGSALAATLIASPSRAQPSKSGTLRYVPASNLTFLDPYSTTALITYEHAYCVFDTLFALDENNEPRPQMVEAYNFSADGRVYEFQLRSGLLFHDLEPVRSADCIASLKRWMTKDSFGQLIAKILDGFETKDDRTFQVRLQMPFPNLVYALAKATAFPTFILPERLAATDPSKPITEMIGSGPFRFVEAEYQPGNQIVYEKFDRYVPRSERASGLAGGKVAHFQRVEWRILPDPATALSALQTGEVDWLQVVQPDLLPVLDGNDAFAFAVRDPLGGVRVMRFNHLTAPFNNVKMRRAVMLAVNQNDYISIASGGVPELGAPCYSAYTCALPNIAPLSQVSQSPDLEQARRLVSEAGYNGEKVVVLNPIDVFGPTMGQLTKSVLESIGLTVELLDLDIGTLLQRRTNRGPTSEGGWSLFHTFWNGQSMSNPVDNVCIRGQGEKGYAGWYRSDRMEALVADWVSAESEAARAALLNETQKLAFEEVPTIFTGLYFDRMAYSRKISDVLSAPVTPMWNVRPT